MNSQQDSKAAATAVWKAFATRDANAVRGVLTDDVEWLAPADNATALALRGNHHMIGVEPIVDFLTRSFGTLANGRRYDNDYCFILEMVGSRVRRIREYMDTRKGYAQIFGDNAAEAELSR